MSAADAPDKTVLILGADGFIGRHIAFHLRRAGWHVIAHARNTRALSHMGFDTLQADLCAPACHDPAFWANHISPGTHVVNAAGLLTGSDAAFRAVHVDAPRAVYTAVGDSAQGVLISAVGIEAETAFGRWRREGEAITPRHISILRPGLVLVATSYGGSSLARALSALPLCTPVVGDGTQRFNPIHAEDLAAIVAHCLTHPPQMQPLLVGGPEDISQAALLQLLRRWMGGAPVPVLRLPLGIAQTLGAVGDLLRLGPISRTSVTQLVQGVHAPLDKGLSDAPAARGVSDFVMAHPAGTQDLWHARLYLLRPVVRLILAAMWLISGLIGLFLPASSFLPLIPDSPLPDGVLIAMARGGGVLDLGIAVALLRGWRPALIGWMQIGIVVGYTVAFTLMAPVLWLLPLGGLLKNLPVIALIAMWMVLERER